MPWNVVGSLFSVVLFGWSLTAAAGPRFFRIADAPAPAVQLLTEAESYLPLKIREALPAGLEVRIEDLGEQTHGRLARRKVIILNRRLLQAFEGPGSESAREAVKTVLHEVAHAYDLNWSPSENEKALRSVCADQQQFEAAQLTPECSLRLKQWTRVSTRVDYVALAGWHPSGFQDGSLSSKNNFQYRSPNPYELKNLQEHFAVNVEHYLVDPDYTCRRPSLTRYFDQEFGLNKFRLCRESLVFADDNSFAQEDVFMQVDPRRIYRIDYLHAGSGKSAMSRWGHSMLRLVTCAPHRTQVGPECLQDEIYHLVLTYRAFVNTPQINNWYGLIGRYPSRLFIVPFPQVKEEYTEGELRELLSYPLVLTEDQKLNVGLKALETHWSYDGKYYFLSNNCAVETFNFLQMSLGRILLDQRPILKPTEVLERLQAEKLVGSAQIFPSRRHQLEWDLRNLGLESQKLETFLDSSFEERHRLYSVNSTPKASQLLSQHSLEKSSLVRHRQRLLNQLVQLPIPPVDASKLEAIQLAFTAPYKMTRIPGYGLPNSTEQNLIREELQTQSKLHSEIYKAATDLIGKFFDNTLNSEIRPTEEGLRNLLRKYRKLLLEEKNAASTNKNPGERKEVQH
ncbi:MAG: DUF4105 domain-containing protein [Bdellovibrionales bacterium]